MPIAKPAGAAGFAVQRFKRMRRLQQRRMPGFTLHQVARAADVAAASIGLDAVLRQGDALLKKLDVAEVAPDDALAELEPLTATD